MGRSKNRKKRRLGAIQRHAVKVDPYAKRRYFWHDWIDTRRDIWSGFFWYSWRVDKLSDKIIGWKEEAWGSWYTDEKGYTHSRLWELNDIRSFDERFSIIYYAVLQLPDTRPPRRCNRHKMAWFKKRRDEWIRDLELRIKGKPVFRYGEIRAKGLDKHPELLDPIKDKEIIEYLEYRKTIRINESPVKMWVDVQNS